MNNNKDTFVQEISNKDSQFQVFKASLANFISSFTSSMFVMALGLMLLDRTKSPISFGIESIVTPIIAILFMITIGNIIDSYDHKKTIAFSGFIKVVLIVLFYLTFNLFSGMYLLIPVILLLIGNTIIANVVSVGFNASVHELVNDMYVQKLSSLSQSAGALSAIASPLIAVFLYSLLGFHFFMLMELVSNVLSLMLTLSMKFHHVKEKSLKEKVDKDKNDNRGFKKAISYINNENMVKYTIIASLFLNFIFASITIGLPFIIKTRLGLGNDPLGILQSISAVGFLAGSIISMSLKSVKYKYKFLLPFFVMGISISMLGLVLDSFTSSYLITFFCGLIILVIGISIALVNVSMQVFIQTTVENNMLGRVSSVIQSTNSIITPVGIFLFSFIFKYTSSYGLVFVISGILTVIFIATLVPLYLNYFNIKKIKRN